jgi:hypothetical protein
VEVVSLEAWGDEGGGMDHNEHDALTGAGWLPPDEAEALQKRVGELEALRAIDSDDLQALTALVQLEAAGVTKEVSTQGGFQAGAVETEASSKLRGLLVKRGVLR